MFSLVRFSHKTCAQNQSIFQNFLAIKHQFEQLTSSLLFEKRKEGLFIQHPVGFNDEGYAGFVQVSRRKPTHINLYKNR